MRYVGVDVGGTKISAAALVDGELAEPSVVPTRTESPDALVDQIGSIIEGLCDSETRAAGVGIPSAVDFATGTAKSGVNVPLEGVPLRNLLTRRVGVPVFVDNDANVAALAEAHEGGRLATRNLVMFTVGTGVGGGLVLDGRLFWGATGAGAEMGHIIIGLDLAAGAPPPSERFPQPGSLEALASGSALDELAVERARSNPSGALGRVAASGEEVTGVHVVKLAKDGDDEARDLLRIVGERARIRLARHGVKAGVYGAALLAVQEAVR